MAVAKRGPGRLKGSANRKQTSVTHAGTRRSETIAQPKAVPVATEYVYQGKENEDPNWGGYHTTIVPKDDPRGDMHMSPVGKFEGSGYKILSTDPRWTEHSGHVLMGIPVDIYNKREADRCREHNSRFADGYAPDLGGDPTGNLKFVQSANINGFTRKSGMRPDPRINVHAQLLKLRGNED